MSKNLSSQLDNFSTFRLVSLTVGSPFSYLVEFFFSNKQIEKLVAFPHCIFFFHKFTSKNIFQLQILITLLFFIETYLSFEIISINLSNKNRFSVFSILINCLMKKIDYIKFSQKHFYLPLKMGK